MRLFFLCILISFTACGYGQIKVCSWNIQNFGKSKSDSEIEFIADVLRNYDAVAILEVVAGYGGAQAVTRLNDVLNRKGARWDYVVSDPTTSVTGGTERYAFLWKTAQLTRVGKPWLGDKYNNEIEREPYFITLKKGSGTFTLVAYHAVPKSKTPPKEIKYLQTIQEEYPDKNLFLCGDFNCPQSHSVFAPLKAKGFSAILQGQKTSIRTKCISGDCLASEYDNIFFNPLKNKLKMAGIIPFYHSFSDIKEARKISDHVPVYMEFTMN